MINAQRPIIPLNAKKVFQGVTWSIWQWPQKMFDGSTRIFEMLERCDAATAIATRKDGTIALLTQEQVRSDQPYLCFPGGQVDPGETIEEALKRELKEEAGCVASSIVLWKSLYPSERMTVGFHYYVARDCTIVGDPNADSGERSQVSWITFEEMLKLATNPRFRHQDLCADFLRMQLNPREKEAFRELLFTD